MRFSLINHAIKRVFSYWRRTKCFLMPWVPLSSASINLEPSFPPPQSHVVGLSHAHFVSHVGFGTLGASRSCWDTPWRRASVCEVLVVSAAWLYPSVSDLEGGPSDALCSDGPTGRMVHCPKGQWSSSWHSAALPPSWLSSGKLVDVAHVALRCVAAAVVAYPNLL